MRTSLALALSLFAASAFAWTTHGPTGGSVLDTAQAPSDARVMYATTPAGIVHSDDAGATWRNVTNGLVRALYIAVDPADPNRVYVTTATGVARSGDGGATWTQSSIAGFGFDPSAIAVDRFDSNVLYLGSECDAELEATPATGFFRSTDRGATWSAVAGANCISDFAIDPVSSDVYAADQFGPQVRLRRGAAALERVSSPAPTHAIVADPRNAAVRYGISNTSLLTSTDSGETWSVVGPAPAALPHALAIDPATGRLFAGTSSGLLRSGDGGRTWASVDNLPKISIGRVMVAPGAIVAGTVSGVFRSTDAMATWTRVDTGDIGTSIGDMAVDPTNPASIYVRSWSGSLFHTSDFGNSWTYFGEMRDAHLAVDAGGQLYVSAGHDVWKRSGDGWEHILHTPGNNSAIVADAQLPGTLWMTSDGLGLLVTHNGGANFDFLPQMGHLTFALFPDPQRSNVLYAWQAGLLRSVDGGVTWTNLPANVPFRSITIPPSDPSFIYVWYSDSLARVSTSGAGATVVGKFPDSANALAVDPHDAKTLYLATTFRGIFRSTDGGATWTNISDLDAIVLAIDRAGLFLHAGSISSGVWEQRLSVPRAVRQR